MDDLSQMSFSLFSGLSAETTYNVWTEPETPALRSADPLEWEEIHPGIFVSGPYTLEMGIGERPCQVRFQADRWTFSDLRSALAFVAKHKTCWTGVGWTLMNHIREASECGRYLITRVRGSLRLTRTGTRAGIASYKTMRDAKACADQWAYADNCLTYVEPSGPVDMRLVGTSENN